MADHEFMDEDGRELLRRLREGHEVIFEGVRVQGIPVEHNEEHCGDMWPCWNTNIQPGDTYMAGRNTGPHLLTCREVCADLEAVESGWIHPVETAYSFNISECIKVEIKL